MESTLLPVLFLLLFTGASPERVSSGFYLWVFTIGGSLPFLMFLTRISPLRVYFLDGFSIVFSTPGSYAPLFSLLRLFPVITVFIKTPVYVLHSWLPKAHVQASTLGSVLLAAIVLKVSVVVYIRSSWLLLNSFLPVHYGSLFCIYGACVASVLSVAQVDLKSLIAFSSIVHIAAPCFSLLTFSSLSLHASLLISLGHGVVSSLLFGVGGCLGYYFTSRNMSLVSGLSMSSALAASLLSFAACLNISIPPFISF